MACDQWDAGAIDSGALGVQLVSLAEALEGIPRRVVEEAREWEGALQVASDRASLGELGLARAPVNGVVDRIRTWVEEMREPGAVEAT